MLPTSYLFIYTIFYCLCDFQIIYFLLNIICKGGLCASGNIFALVKVSRPVSIIYRFFVFFLFWSNKYICLSVCLSNLILIEWSSTKENFVDGYLRLKNRQWPFSDTQYVRVTFAITMCPSSLSLLWIYLLSTSLKLLYRFISNFEWMFHGGHLRNL